MLTIRPRQFYKVNDFWARKLTDCLVAQIATADSELWYDVRHRVPR